MQQAHAGGSPARSMQRCSRNVFEVPAAARHPNTPAPSRHARSSAAQPMPSRGVAGIVGMRRHLSLHAQRQQRSLTRERHAELRCRLGLALRARAASQPHSTPNLQLATAAVVCVSPRPRTAERVVCNINVTSGGRRRHARCVQRALGLAPATSPRVDEQGQSKRRLPLPQRTCGTSPAPRRRRCGRRCSSSGGRRAASRTLNRVCSSACASLQAPLGRSNSALSPRGP